MFILTPLFTALIAAGAFIKIPIGAIPITLQTLFCYLCALLLPTSSAIASVALYLFLGAVGLPIFTSGGGIAALIGPTGGFLFAMLPTVAIGSILAKFKRGNILYNVFVAVIMTVVIYLGGILWLQYKAKLSLSAALGAACIPFIPGDALKIIVSASVAKILYPECEKIRTHSLNRNTQ